MDANLQTLIIVLAATVLVGLIISVIFPLLRKKGVDVDEILSSTKDALAAVNNTMETLRPFLPEGESADTFDKIMVAAHIGVANAEQLSHIGKLDPGERKTAARQYINDAVKLMGVEVTPEVSRLIDGAIEAEVLDIGHKLLTEAPQKE